MKYLITTLFTAVFLLMFSVSITAQCGEGRFVSPNDKILDIEKRKEGTVRYKLPDNTKFYFKMDNSINSETYRSGDIVSFTIIEDIYGEFVDYKQRTLEKKPGQAEAEKDKIPYIAGDRVKVIPKNTKGYGRVNFSQRPTLFYAGGKSKIYVLPQYIVLDSGKCMKIVLPRANSTSNPEANSILYSAENIKPCKYQDKDAIGKSKKRKIRKTDSNNKGENLIQCIEGRRPKVFNSGIVKAATAGLLAGLNDDNNSDRLSIASLTILNEGAGVDGIVDLLTGKNAEISSSLIFEAELLQTDGIVEHPPAKEEKKE